MQENKEDKASSKEAVIESIMQNEEIKKRVDKEAEEKTQLLYKRNEFLQEMENDPFSSMEKYKTVAEDDFMELKKTARAYKDDISKISSEQIDEISKKIRSAKNINEGLQKQLEKYTPTPLKTERTIGNTAASLDDILMNPEAYEDSKIMSINKGGHQEFSLYKTQEDEKKIDLDILGDRSCVSSVKAMNRLEDDFEEMLQRNAKYKKYSKIL